MVGTVYDHIMVRTGLLLTIGFTVKSPDILVVVIQHAKDP